MSEHHATVEWRRGEQAFVDGRYSRAHVWRFDGGAEVPASASPHVVRLPFSDPAGVDPEEAFVAALAACHMLFFLSLAARAGYVVDAYDDLAVGRMGRDERGRMAMLEVTLRPRVDFSGDRQPDAEELARLHDAAHDECFIANSVRTLVRHEPQAAGPAV